LVLSFSSRPFLVQASDVLKLDPSNFDTEVGGDAPALVEFFAPWCGHCKSLAPEWELAATAFKGQPVKIAAVDADAHRDLGSRFGVKGFPTIKYFPAGSSEPEDYNAGRTAPDIIDWVNGKTGLRGKVKTTPTAVVVLDAQNFHKIVEDEKKEVLVEFYAPWCGHCKRLAPDYEQVALSFDGESSVVIAKVDCDANKDLCSSFGVSGYPTLKYFPRTNKAGEEYNEGRTPADFVNFINKNAGTQRTVGGGFTNEAGRITALDHLAEKLKQAASNDEKNAIVKEIQTLLEGEEVKKHANAEFGKFYELTARKLSEGNAEYAANEVARLSKLLLGGSVNSKNKAQFQKRINIVRLFTA